MDFVIFLLPNSSFALLSAASLLAFCVFCEITVFVSEVRSSISASNCFIKFLFVSVNCSCSKTTEFIKEFECFVSKNISFIWKIFNF